MLPVKTDLPQPKPSNFAMSESRRHQQRLFDLPNPLNERLGEAFFDRIPQEPGVYRMYGKTGELLYVGKAKNLRRRLFTYRNVRKETASRKTVRLVRMIDDIRYEQTDTEEEALLLENQLLREHRPPFNHANTQPETYYFISLERSPDHWQFSLRMREPDDLGRDKRGYGAFKGHGRVRRSLGALLRQLWVLIEEIDSSFLFPSVLTRRLTPMNYKLSMTGLDDDQEQLLWRRVNQFLKGTGSTLQQQVLEHAEQVDLLSAQIGPLILEDLERLHRFYERCTTANYEIAQAFDLDNHLIPQDALDDLLVQRAFLMQPSQEE
jgi:predicted GIY-YIG superfamily endonuclease